MSNSTGIPNLQRVTFFPGELLRAADLTEFSRACRELRWLHTRSLHPWGIGIGLDVSGEKGESTVTIHPGYAVDCQGREIILTEVTIKTVPAVAGVLGGKEAVYYLVASYLGDDGQSVVEQRNGVCAPDGSVRLSETPALDWRPANQLREGLDLILAQAWIRNCQLSRPVSLAARRSARPSQQPYIFAGQTPAGKTAWQLWKPGGKRVGVTVDVDTSAARFRTTPRYVAHIQGEHVIPLPPNLALLVGVVVVSQPTPNGFTAQVLLPRMTAGTVAINPTTLSSKLPTIFSLGWSVVWMGVEG